ncbi:MAG: hypothetical protein COA84_13625 [Robiginitomaculum sp.]|nr:MAG: hypothetical protein COA84_13625 [Robiginitomaculum sp.]
MKIKIEKAQPERELVGLLGDKGQLFLRFESSMAPNQRTVVLNGIGSGEFASVVKTNGTFSIEAIGHQEHTPIYKGDTISITF